MSGIHFWPLPESAERGRSSDLQFRLRCVERPLVVSGRLPLLYWTADQTLCRSALNRNSFLSSKVVVAVVTLTVAAGYPPTTKM